MRQRAIRLYRRKQPIYFFLRSTADVLQNVNRYIRNIGKSLERL
nr:MAG TPA: Transcription factor DP1, Transcription factor factor, cell-cycle regulation, TRANSCRIPTION.9A [Caudoviricetes sp.]